MFIKWHMIKEEREAIHASGIGRNDLAAPVFSTFSKLHVHTRKVRCTTSLCIKLESPKKNKLEQNEKKFVFKKI